MPPITARTFLGASRLAVGVGSLSAPDHAARAFGIDPRRADGFVTRLFGSRELLLATLLLAARDERQVEAVAGVGVAIDSLDALSALVELRAGRMSAWTAVSGGAGAVLFAALGALALRGARDRRLGAAAQAQR